MLKGDLETVQFFVYRERFLPSPSFPPSLSLAWKWKDRDEP